MEKLRSREAALLGKRKERRRDRRAGMNDRIQVSVVEVVSRLPR
jgi:hypothetical protein